MVPVVGLTVSYYDDWRQERKYGEVIDVRRSSIDPWQIAVVRLLEGSEVEVHPDRLEAVGGDWHDL
jgi:hypothetical protein